MSGVWEEHGPRLRFCRPYAAGVSGVTGARKPFSGSYVKRPLDALGPVPVRCAARRDIAFDVEAFIQQATSFPNGANDDAVDACSQYLNEVYLVGGEATLSLPRGLIPLSAARRQRQQALPVQQRLTAGGQHSPWGHQGLSPFQQRLTDRQLRR
jgi:hypothetical protein